MVSASEFKDECKHEAKPVAVVSSSAGHQPNPLLALVTFLSQLVPTQTEQCKAIVKASDAVAVPKFQVSKDEFNLWMFLMTVLLVTFFIGGAVGCALGCMVPRLRKPAAADQEREETKYLSPPHNVSKGMGKGSSVASKSKANHRRAISQSRDVETQSQVTYRRELATPRFQPLTESRQGAWVTVRRTN